MRLPALAFAVTVAIGAVLYSSGSLPFYAANDSNTSAALEPPHGVDEWQEQDVLDFFSLCKVNASHIQAMRSLGLNGHSLMLLDNHTLHSIGIAASELQHVLAEIETLRQRVHAAPLDFWEWRAVNLRFNDMWLMPLSLDPRTLLAWARLRGGGDGPIAGNALHVHGFYTFWATWLLNPHFAMYRAMPDDSSFPAELQRGHYLILSFTAAYKVLRWLSVFRDPTARGQWREIIASHLGDNSQCRSRTTSLQLLKDAVKFTALRAIGQAFISIILLTFALVTYYVLWYLSLRFFLHVFFYTFEYLVLPCAFFSSLYAASPLIREALLRFENGARQTSRAAIGCFPSRIAMAVNDARASKLSIDRGNLVQTSVAALRPLQQDQFHPRCFKISFVGEVAIDQGGVFCEWHSATSKLLSDIALLQVTNSFGEPTGLHRLNPLLNNSSSSSREDNLWLLGCIFGLSVSEKLPTGVHITPAFAKRLLRREDTLTLQDLAFELPTFEYLLTIQQNNSGDKDGLDASLRDWDIRFRTVSRASQAAAAGGGGAPAEDGELFSPLSRTHSSSEGVTSDSFDEYVKLMIQRHLVDCNSTAITFLRNGFEHALDAAARGALTPQSLTEALRGDIDLAHLRRVIQFDPKGACNQPRQSRAHSNIIIQPLTSGARCSATGVAPQLPAKRLLCTRAHSVFAVWHRPPRPLEPRRRRLAARSSDERLVSRTVA
jgi:hypothetical protein